MIAREHFSIKAGKSKTIKAHVARNGRRRVLRNRKREVPGDGRDAVGEWEADRRVLRR